MARLKPETFQNFVAQANHPVAKVPTLSLCVAGRRPNDALVGLLIEACVNMRNNATVTGITSVDGVITVVTVACAGGSNSIKVNAVVDATSGFASGNLTRDSYMTLHEAVFGLPLFTPSAVEKMGIHSIDTRQETLVE